MKPNISFEAAGSYSSKFKDIEVELNMSIRKLIFEYKDYF